MSGSFCSLHHEIHYIVTLLIVKGAGICSLFHEIHYIKIRYIEVWVYLLFKKLNIQKSATVVMLGQRSRSMA